MPQVGYTLSADSAPSWLDTQGTLACLEVPAVGFFAKPSPYLASLGSRYRVILGASSFSLAAPAPVTPGDVSGLISLCQIANVAELVHPLGFRAVDEFRLGVPLPFRLSSDTLSSVGQRLSAASKLTGTRAIIEPIATPLRVPGTLSEVDFLVQLCQATNSRLLLDLSTALVMAAKHGLTPAQWVASFPPPLVAAVRVGGCSFSSGRWRPDARVDPGDAIWQLLDVVLTRAIPDFVLLNRAVDDDAGEAVTRDIARIHAVIRDVPVPVQAGATQHVRASEIVRPCPGRKLFVLDDCGVFYSDSSKELTLFNTAATLLWCLIEQGMSADALVDQYRDMLGLSEEDARSHVRALLRRWHLVGHLQVPRRHLGDQDVSLTVAVAALVCNPALRQTFRESPANAADVIGVSGADLSAFLALVPDDLDAVAEDLEIEAHATESHLPEPALAVGPRASHDATPLCRHYRLVSTTYAISVPCAELSDRVQAAFGHLECQDHEFDVLLELQQVPSGGWRVSDATGVVALVPTLDGVVPTLKQLVRESAVERHSALVSVHAGAVSFGDGAVLLPARAGSGKTTLTAGLLQAGATYFSDEIALLGGAEMHLTPVPLALTVKAGSVQPLESRYPHLMQLAEHLREDQVRVRYLPPPRVTQPDPDRQERVRWIVFPQYAPGTPTTLTTVERPEALRRLLDQASVNRLRMDEANAEALVKWMRGVECYELRHSSLDEAVSKLLELANTGRPGLPNQRPTAN